MINVMQYVQIYYYYLFLILMQNNYFSKSSLKIHAKLELKRDKETYQPHLESKYVRYFTNNLIVIF